MSKFLALALLLAFGACHLDAKPQKPNKPNLSLTSRAASGCAWDYTDFSYWAKCSYTCGYETNQEKGSPINIKPASATPQTFTLSTPDGGNIESESYRDKYTSGSLHGKWTRKNFTLQFTIDTSVDDDDLPIIKYANSQELTELDSDEYKLLRVEYRWGMYDSEGSEHTIDGSSAPLEVHFVHKNMNSDARYEDQLLVIGVLYEKVDTADTETNWIKWVSANAKNIARRELIDADGKDDDGNPTEGGTPVSIDKTGETAKHWNLWQTLKEALEDGHYAYKGSLTIPGCDEQVTWIVGKNKLKVHGPDLENFRKLIHPQTGTLVKRNWRPTQDLGGREVYKMDASYA